jgi:clan AA aspartic protease (TIGR02281 family)
MLNDHPTRMIVDTGAMMTVIRLDTAQRLHLTLDERGYGEGIGGRQTNYVFDARTFAIGRLHGQHLTLDASEMGQPSREGFEGGLFGADFLAAYDVDLDLPEHKAILYKPVKGCGHAAAFLSQPLYGLPMLSSYNPSDYRAHISVGIEGKRLRALVDTGAPHTVIFRQAAHRVGLSWNDLKGDPHFHVGGIGPRASEAIRHKLTSLTIGELTVRNLPVAIVDDNLGEDDMLLGLDFLSRVHAWFDFSSKTLVLQYPPKPSPPAPS